MNNQDYFRFIHDLYEFNDENLVGTTYFKFRDYGSKGNVAAKINKERRKPIVDILAFCLMSNHYHIMLTPRTEKGISQFMHKLNMGYSHYFNKKHERTGTLFQGKYKKILITDDTHFLHLPFYIHLNPLDLSYPEWRENKITNPNEALKFLKSYRWSSHLDYLGIKNFPSVLNMKPLMEVLGNHNDYQKLVENYLKDIQIDEGVILE